MKSHRKIQDFAHREDGSLLVFFVISIVAILGIMALSFDMGRRASTQTDMQSFADNVALAAAGELDGGPNAIARATAAAQTAIVAANETLKVGASGTAAQLALAPNTGPTANHGLLFYTSLPATDAPSALDVATLASEKYDLPTANTTSVDADAVYVGVRLDTVDVDWLFGGVFGNNLTISDDIGAVAVAGNTAYTCDVAPLMFCMPQSASGSPVDMQPGWSLQLRTARQGAAWGPGDFGFLDVSQVPSTTCDHLLSNGKGNPNNGNNGNEARWQACLLAQGLGQCFNSRRVNIQTGQRQGQETANFNILFGIFTATMNTFQNDPNYAPGPHSVTGQDYSANNSCNPSGPSLDTIDFPPDDCFAAGNCTLASNPLNANRFGDGNWTTARAAHTDKNYDYTNSAGVDIDGSFFEFPEANLTRYQYYQREIERSANGGIMTRYSGLNNSVYNADNDGGRPANGNGNPTETDDQYTTWDDYWSDSLPSSGVNPIIPDAHTRADNGYPQCAGPQVNPTTNANRRVIVIAGIDCNANPIGGTMPPGVPVHQYYRAFLMGPAREVSNNTNGPVFDIWMEIIQPLGGQAGASTTDNGIFREVIQLYK